MRTVPRFARAAFGRPVRLPLAVFGAAIFLVTAAPAGASVQRVETPIVSASSQIDVAASLVRIRVPLPAPAAPHPEACGGLQYELFRSVGGPADSMQADAVAVLM